MMLQTGKTIRLIRRLKQRFGRRARHRIAQFFWASSSLCLLAASAVLALAAADRQFPPPLGAVSEVSTVVVDRRGNLLRAFTIEDGRWRLPVRLEEVDGRFIDMLLAYEDKRFYRHNGIDPLAMTRAAWQLATSGRIVSGGSTLSMQVARLIEPRAERSFAAKGLQMLRALQIERRLSKRRILELYLTIAPYGGNLEGVHAASLAYFNKAPANLTVEEAALLISLPQLPEARRPDRHPMAAQQARDRVLSRMVEAGVIPALDAQHASSRTVPKRRRELPAHAAHLSDRLRAAAPQVQRHEVTLDRRLQSDLEILARQRIARLSPKLSMAIMVADARTGDILARVGSPDHLSHMRAGAIDMSLAVRSPGSTLKPFIYGLAFDAGIARPASLIEDAPADFAGYAPTNFDRTYQGTVTVAQALQLSLNIPAVTLLETVGPLRLVNLFKRAGIDPHLPLDEHPSLAIGLGGVGMTLEDLVSLYCAFPMLGDTRDVTDRPRGTYAAPQAIQVLSPQGAWYVNRILAGTPPPEHAADGGIAFKTGTSYGYRDAWAIGYDGVHVMGVWVGRPDGSSVPGLTGRTAAAPVLFEGFRRIAEKSVPLPAAPAGTVLQDTGDLPVALRHVEREGVLLTAHGPARPSPVISYPPDGAKVDLAGWTERGGGTLVLKVRGGAAPFSWFANGVPVDVKNRRRQSAWTPDSPGFSTLTVIDATGRSDRVTVFLK